MPNPVCRGSRGWRWLLCWVCTALTLAYGQGAWGLDKGKAAAALAEKAAAAFEAGDMAIASDLYYEAWRADPTLLNALYNSARAAQMAGRLEVAQQRFGQFVAAPGAEGAQIDKARGYLREIATAIQQAGIAAAEAAERQSPAEGYLRWLDLAQRNPNDARLWLRTGLAADKAGLKKEAVAALTQARDRSAVGSSDRAVASAKLAELDPPAKPGEAPRTAPKPAAAASGPPSEPGVATSAAAPSKLPWLVAAGGAFVAGVGAALAIRAASDRTTFENKMAPGFSGTKLAGTRAAALEQANDIGSRQTVGAVVTGTGSAVALAGLAWALFGNAPTVPGRTGWWIAPTWVGPSGGVALSGGF